MICTVFINFHQIGVNDYIGIVQKTRDRVVTEQCHMSVV